MEFLQLSSLLIFLVSTPCWVNTQALVVGFAERMYTVTEGESVQVCVTLISPEGDIGTARVLLEVGVDSNSQHIPTNESEATADRLDIFGFFMMYELADYEPPVVGAPNQIRGSPITQSNRVVCYTQDTYEDNRQEGEEFFALQLFAQSDTDPRTTISETLGTTLIEIRDNDVSIIGFDPIEYNVTEGNSTNLVIRRTGNAEVHLVARVNSNDITTTADVDYIRLDGVEVTFGPGVFIQTVPVRTISDVPAEGNEELQVFLSSVTSGVDVTATTALVTITEEVIPRLSFSTGSAVIVEGNAPARVCLVLNVPLSVSMEVAVISSPGSASSTDFVRDTLVASFAAGDTEACVEFTIRDDNIALEGNETFVASFELPSGMLLGEFSLAVFTIIDDDKFSVYFTKDVYSYFEGDPAAEVCLEGSGEIAQPVTVIISSLMRGTATAGDDYTPVGTTTIVFRPEDPHTMCVPVQLVEDDFVEEEESFLIRIHSVSAKLPSAVIGPQAETTIIIRDNDMKLEAIVGQRQAKFSWSFPPEHNEVITSYTLSCSPSPSSLPQTVLQSGPHTVTGFSPETAYSCSVFATYSQGSRLVANITFVTQHDSTFFQLRLSGPFSTCIDMISTERNMKLQDITNEVVEQMIASCAICGIIDDVITEPTFACFPESPNYVTYRATLKGTSDTASVSLISFIEDWVSGRPSIIVTGVLLSVDSDCSVAISSLSEEECSPTERPNTNITTVPNSDTGDTSDKSSPSDNTAAIIGGVVAVVLILAITAAFIAIVVVRYLRRDMSTKSAEKFGLAQLSMSAAVEGISITTSSNTAYELTKQVREHEDGYELVGTPPKGSSEVSANHEGQYEVPTYPPCKGQLPAIPSSVAGAEEVDGVYEIIPGEQ